MAVVFPFPASRQVDKVERVARTMARRGAIAGEALLLRAIQAEYSRQIDLGVLQRAAEDDAISFVSAVRAQLCRQVFSRPGGAA